MLSGCYDKVIFCVPFYLSQLYCNIPLNQRNITKHRVHVRLTLKGIIFVKKKKQKKKKKNKKKHESRHLWLNPFNFAKTHVIGA